MEYVGFNLPKTKGGAVHYIIQLDAYRAVTVAVLPLSNAAYIIHRSDGNPVYNIYTGETIPNSVADYNERSVMELVSKKHEQIFGKTIIPIHNLSKHLSIQADQLVLEVTRRCNMMCEHCLRGDAQNYDMPLNILHRVTELIGGVGQVTFTGGEPSLNVEAIDTYFELAEHHNSLPASFYVVTNGLAKQEELAVALLKAYQKMDEQECCGVTVSRDMFHQEFWENEFGSSIIEGLSFYSPTDKTHDTNGNDDLNWVMNIGRAAENGIGNTSNPWRTIPKVTHSFNELVQDYYRDRNGHLHVTMDMLYVSANGNVVDICDITYEDIDAEPICHINELPALLMEYVASMSLDALTAPALVQDDSNNASLRYLPECADYDYLVSHLPQDKILMLESILDAYCNEKIDVDVIRDEVGSIDFDNSSFALVVKDEDYEVTGYESLTIRWFESFEDTGYLIEALGGDPSGCP